MPSRLRLPALAALLALAATGCADRTHLTAAYGRSYRMAAERQTLNPNAGAKPHTLAESRVRRRWGLAEAA